MSAYRLKKSISILLITIISSNICAPLLAENLPAGTAIQLRLNQTLSGATAQTGSFVALSVVSDVVINGVTLVKAGAQAEGQVSSAKKAGMIGQPGSVGITVTTVTAVNGTKIPVQAISSAEGDDKMVISIILGLLCIIGFLQKGGEGELNNTQIINARTLSNVEIN